MPKLNTHKHTKKAHLLEAHLHSPHLLQANCHAYSKSTPIPTQPRLLQVHSHAYSDTTTPKTHTHTQRNHTYSKHCVAYINDTATPAPTQPRLLLPHCHAYSNHTTTPTPSTLPRLLLPHCHVYFEPTPTTQRLASSLFSSRKPSNGESVTRRCATSCLSPHDVSSQAFHRVSCPRTINAHN